MGRERARAQKFALPPLFFFRVFVLVPAGNGPLIRRKCGKAQNNVENIIARQKKKKKRPRQDRADARDGSDDALVLLLLLHSSLICFLFQLLYALARFMDDTEGEGRESQEGSIPQFLPFLPSLPKSNRATAGKEDVCS
jgi:hypothetical protein